MRKLTYFLLIVLLLLLATGPVLALEAGGKVEIGLNGTLASDGEVESGLVEKLNLELFLPDLGKTEARYEFVVTKPLQDLLADEEISYFTQKLYLKHKFNDFHLTVGKQPISWSFGSLLNPVDFTLGAVALEEESNSKFQNAVETYLPLNWNSNLTFVSAFPGGFSGETEEIKWGFRGRTGFMGYDLTLNYVQEPETTTTTLPIPLPEKRIGLTFKGDLQDIGIYGAMGYYFSKDKNLEESKSFLLGADYSYNLDYFTTVRMQLEYLGFGLEFLNPLYRESVFNLDEEDKRLDLVAGNLNYPIDDFSSLSLVSLINLDDKSLILSPTYQTTLPNNLDLKLMTSLFIGEEEDLFGAGSKTIPLLPVPLDIPRGSLGVSLGYSF